MIECLNDIINMKTQLKIFVNIVIISVFLISCDSGNGNDTDNDTIQTTDTNFTDQNSDTITIDSLPVNETDDKTLVSKYICPQGDKEGNLDKPGICPVCGMELIENPDYIIK